MASIESNGSNGHLANGAAASDGATPEIAVLSGAQWAAIELMQWADLFLSHWLLLIAVPLVVGGYVGIREKYFATRWYRAQATITPISPDQSIASSVGLGASISSQGDNGVMSLLTLGDQSDGSSISQQYVASMRSFVFTSALLDRYKLIPQLFPAANAKTTAWALYLQTLQRFDTEFDYKSGNLSLYFSDPDPALAKRVLGFYLESLRDKVRGEQVKSATSAVSSLQDEIRRTSDPLLQTQLYELIARQIERGDLAQVDADFAYKTVEPPLVPDNYFAPQARRDATVAATLALFLTCGAILLWDFVSRTRAQLRLLQRAPIAPPGARPLVTSMRVPPEPRLHG